MKRKIGFYANSPAECVYETTTGKDNIIFLADFSLSAEMREEMIEYSRQLSDLLGVNVAIIPKEIAGEIITDGAEIMLLRADKGDNTRDRTDGG